VYGRVRLAGFPNNEIGVRYVRAPLDDRQVT